VLDVAYVGSHGVNSPAQVNLNPGMILGAGSAGQPYFAKFGRAVAETTAFTWQKAMAYTGGDNGGLANWYINPQRNYARVGYDRTLNLVQSYVYRAPFGRGQRFLKSGLPSKILGGWQATGILTARTGAPLTFTDGAGSVAVNATGNSQTPDLVSPIKVLHGINVGNPWFDRSSFARTTPGRFGSMGRSVWSGPNQSVSMPACPAEISQRTLGLTAPRRFL
jgi:hypothetical protein